jgi:small subunit ribosomal protein S3
MGQKVHPYILRIGFGKSWKSRWFTNRKREYAQYLDEDLRVREIIKSFYNLGSIATIIIERVSSMLMRIRIRTSRPGVIIGRRGQDIERLKSKLANITKKEVVIDVEEVMDPSTEAQLIAELIAFQLTKRVQFRRAMKRALHQAINLGCEGIKVKCSGRLGGVEIARKEGYKHGKIPLQTFRADIDYGFCVAKTTYGTIGVKSWVYKGEKRLGAYLSQSDVADNEEENAITQKS